MEQDNPTFTLATTLDAILHSEQDTDVKTDQLDKLFLYLLSEYTDSFLIPFNSVFAQLSFAISQLKLKSAEAYILHYYRINIMHHGQAEMSSDIDPVAIRVGVIRILAEAINPFLLTVGKAELSYALNKIHSRKLHDEYLSSVRFAIQRIDDDFESMYGIDESRPQQEIKIILDRITQENLINNLKHNLPFFQLPLMVSLISVRIISGDYHPEAVILYPDFLIDVTAIAMCYGFNYQISGLHFLGKFTPKSYSDSILKGQIANYFLDQLISHQDLDFKQAIGGIFKLNPLFFAQKSDQEIKDLIRDMSGHFQNLVETLQVQFPQQGIEPENSMIEPSFYAINYGIQGRLDLFSLGEAHKTIVELKSGQIFKPNSYGINHSHYIQTLLYNLLVNPLKDKVVDFRAFILYSIVERQSLRYVPVTAPQQYEAILVRNNLVAIEYRLGLINANGEDVTNVFGILEELNEANLFGFSRSNLELLRNGFKQLNTLEQKYLRAMAGFIAREYALAKPGIVRDQFTQGQSSLWINGYKEKDEHYSILGFLRFDASVTEGQGILTFLKSEKTNPLADFRNGDVVLLYVTDDAGSFVWAGSQVFKATIVSNETDTVVIRLRNPQANQTIFKATNWWNIEKDVIDTSFNNQSKAIGAFALTDSRKRQLILGLRPPAQNNVGATCQLDHIEPYLRSVIEPALNCGEYYLIWGPPGTGKTSHAARHIIAQYTAESSDPLLVVAYTNRAVDELCEVIESIDGLSTQYMRIGSRYSTAEKYQDKLLDVALGEIPDRKGLMEFITSRKVVCGTLSSILGKEELFDLLHFECALVDEASQILDPQMIHLVCLVDRFILIGDHNQLPAVVAQPAEYTRVTDEEMNAAGLYNLRSSLFERLYKLAVENGWTHAYGLLARQGRMHQEIMDFPAKYFYEDRLETVLSRQQVSFPDFTSQGTGVSGFLPMLATKRSLFVHVDPDKTVFSKMNDPEAIMIKKILTDLRALYASHGADLRNTTIGIITPFRAQIININQHLSVEHSDLDILVDTVERFQGGARDIILLSMVVSIPGQIRMISETGKGEIDRKMNVAITRAREQLIMVGNQEILSLAHYYRLFIAEYGVRMS
jgi:DNA replication ATP-dependent helicase Dna2